MIVEIRLYKSHDTDLVALCSAGYCISNMLKEALIGYANGTPVHFIIDEFIPFDVSSTKSVRTRFTMPDTELKTCYLLRNIKKGYRNAFCKAVLRNSLIQQNLTCYFSDLNLVQLQNINIQYRNISLYPNVKPCSSMKMREKQIEFLGKKIKRENPKPVNNAYTNAYINGNPYAGMNMNFMPNMPAINTPVARTQQSDNKAKKATTTDYLPLQEDTQTPVTVVASYEQENITTPPVVNIQELTNNNIAASENLSSQYNKEENHVIKATESQEYIDIEPADDDDLMDAFNAI